MASVRINSIIEESIVDGPGLRLVVFTQGCPHHCPGCHNPQTHDPAGGYTVDTADILARMQENPLLDGITFSGGEPFLQAGPLAALAQAVHAAGMDVVTYTGYVYEDLLAQDDPAVTALLQATDLLVDGPYIEALQNTALPFRGSSNQRLLNLAEKN